MGRNSLLRVSEHDARGRQDPGFALGNQLGKRKSVDLLFSRGGTSEIRRRKGVNLDLALLLLPDAGGKAGKVVNGEEENNAPRALVGG